MSLYPNGKLSVAGSAHAKHAVIVRFADAEGKGELDGARGPTQS
jgi:hypothetical protein